MNNNEDILMHICHWPFKRKSRTAPSESKVLQQHLQPTPTTIKKRITSNLSLSDHSQSNASKAKVSVESSWMKNECFCLPDVSNLKLIKTLDKTIISLQNKQKFFSLNDCLKMFSCLPLETGLGQICRILNWSNLTNKSFSTNQTFRRWTPKVEQWPCDKDVLGSIPATSSLFLRELAF